MSDDTKPPRDPSGGYFTLPKRIPIGGWLVGLVAAVFAMGGWITALQLGVHEAQAQAEQAHERVSRNEQRWKRIEKYMCLTCKPDPERGVDCSDICGLKVWRRP